MTTPPTVVPWASHAVHWNPVLKDRFFIQCFYLDEELRGRLKREHNVEGYAICQCLGDGVFIPAGAPHQVTCHISHYTSGFYFAMYLYFNSCTVIRVHIKFCYIICECYHKWFSTKH